MARWETCDNCGQPRLIECARGVTQSRRRPAGSRLQITIGVIPMMWIEPCDDCLDAFEAASGITEDRSDVRLIRDVTSLVAGFAAMAERKGRFEHLTPEWVRNNEGKKT
jgi:hypothetical protein